MSSSCIEEVSVPNDDWYRIAAELLGRAGIEINGSAPSDLRVKNPLFFKRVLQEGSLGLGESYMDGWWECERLDIFFHKVLRAGLEKQLPHHFKDTLRIAGARLFNLQSKKRAGLSVKSTTTSATISSAGCLIPICNIPAVTGKRRRASRPPSRLSWISSAANWSWSQACGYWILAVDGAVSPNIWREIIRSASWV